MRILLDTHAFLWFFTDDPQLSAAAKALIVDPTNEILVSPASYWEVAIFLGICNQGQPWQVSAGRAF